MVHLKHFSSVLLLQKSKATWLILSFYRLAKINPMIDIYCMEWIPNILPSVSMPRTINPCGPIDIFA